jgi:hypothetical protein
MQTTPKEYRTTKLWRSTLRILRMLSAMTGKPMVKVADDLARKELAKVEKEQAK